MATGDVLNGESLSGCSSVMESRRLKLLCSVPRARRRANRDGLGQIDLPAQCICAASNPANHTSNICGGEDEQPELTTGLSRVGFAADGARLEKARAVPPRLRRPAAELAAVLPKPVDVSRSHRHFDTTHRLPAMPSFLGRVLLRNERGLLDASSRHNLCAGVPKTAPFLLSGPFPHRAWFEFKRIDVQSDATLVNLSRRSPSTM